MQKFKNGEFQTGQAEVKSIQEETPGETAGRQGSPGEEAKTE